MLTSLKNLTDESALSPLHARNMRYQNLIRAITEKDEKSLAKEVSAGGFELSENEQRLVMEGLINSDWPKGYQVILDTFDLHIDEDFRIEYIDYRGICLLMEKLIDKRSFNLLEHLWDKFPADQCAEVLKNQLSVEFAKVLVNVGLEKTLSELMRPEALEKVYAHLLPESLESFSSLMNSESRADQVEVTSLEKVIRVLLHAGGSHATANFWDKVCQLDDPKLLQHLAKSGVIEERHCKITDFKCANFKDQFRRVSTTRFPKEWVSSKNGLQSFNLAEIVCLFSPRECSVLNELILGKEFRDMLMNSAAAKHMLISFTWRQGAGIFSELSKHGCDMLSLVNDSGETPLHMVAKYERGHKWALESVSEYTKICPQWLEARCDRGLTPLQCARESQENASEKIAALLEYEQIHTLVQRRPSENTEVQAPAKTYRV